MVGRLVGQPIGPGNLPFEARDWPPVPAAARKIPADRRHHAPRHSARQTGLAWRISGIEQGGFANCDPFPSADWRSQLATALLRCNPTPVPSDEGE